MARGRGSKKTKIFSYDVCLSFAGEDRAYVKQVAELLKANGLEVFYDEFEEANLWGRDLYEYLDRIYSTASRYCVVFCSKNYSRKLWTNHERKSAQERAFLEHEAYILPARFDGTRIPGIRSTVGHIDLKKTSPDQLVSLIVKKVGPSKLIEINSRSNYFPRILDNLYRQVGATTQKEKETIYTIAHSFYQSLSYMSSEELSMVFPVFMFGCPHDLPNNVHIDIDLLRRVTQVAVPKIKVSFGKLKSLGFDVTFPVSAETSTNLVQIVWTCRVADSEVVVCSDTHTGIANSMINIVRENYCQQHGMQLLSNLNFSALSSASYVAC